MLDALYEVGRNDYPDTLTVRASLLEAESTEVGHEASLRLMLAVRLRAGRWPGWNCSRTARKMARTGAIPTSCVFNENREYYIWSVGRMYTVTRFMSEEMQL